MKCHSRMLCVVLQHGVFHFIVSIFLLHLTFAAETAVFLVACLAFLASFAALLVHRKRGNYPCLPFTLSLSQHCKSFPRSGWNVFLQISPLYSLSLGEISTETAELCVTKIQWKSARRDPSLLLLSLANIIQYYIQIYRLKAKKKPTKNLIKQGAHVEFKLLYEKYCNL